MRTFARGPHTAVFLAFLIAGADLHADESLAIVDPVQNAMDTAARIRKMRELKIHRSLSEDTRLEFIETPLEDVVAFLSDQHDISIRMDTLSMDDLGISTDVPVTANLKGLSLASGLKHMLRELELTYVVQDEVLLMTTQEYAESIVTTQLYAVEDLVTVEEPIDQIAEVVKETLGGNKSDSISRVAAFRGNLIVRTTFAGHGQVAELLGAIRGRLRGETAAANHPLHGWVAPAIVSLRGVRLTSDDVKYLSAQTHLQRLELQRCGLTNQAFELMNDLPALRSLSLDENHIDDQALANIARFSGLTSLTLSNTAITEVGLAYLSKLPKIENVDIAKTKVRDFSPLARMSKLQSLNVSDTQFTDKDLKTLVGLKSLRTLQVNGTQVSMEGLQQLVEAKGLEHLTIGGSRDKTAEFPEFAKQLKALKNALAGCEITTLYVDRTTSGDPFGNRNPFGGRNPFGAGGEDPFADGGSSDPFGSNFDPFNGGASTQTDNDPFN